MTEQAMHEGEGDAAAGAASYAAATFSAEGLDFHAVEGGPATWSGTLMRGRRVVNSLFGRLLVRPESFAAMDGVVVPLLRQHAKAGSSYGYGTLSVNAQAITIKGALHVTAAAESFAAEMRSLIEGGVKLEMSAGVLFDLGSERKTRNNEPGDYTFDVAQIEEASVVWVGAMSGTRFAFAAGAGPSLDYTASAEEQSEEQAAVVEEAGAALSLTDEQRASLERWRQLKEMVR